MTTSDVGILAEHYASEYLKSKGYKILGRNYHKPWGEIDLVAEKDGILIFAEVKANVNLIPGFEPELRGDTRKMAKVVRAARTYLADKEYPADQEWQLDLIGVIFDRDNKVAQFRHFKNIEI